jgi:hypothetical protein
MADASRPRKHFVTGNRRKRWVACAVRPVRISSGPPRRYAQSDDAGQVEETHGAIHKEKGGPVTWRCWNWVPTGVGRGPG